MSQIACVWQGQVTLYHSSYILEQLNIDLFSVGKDSNEPDSKDRGANMGPTWGLQDPGGPYVGHMSLAIRGVNHFDIYSSIISVHIEV